MGDYLDNAEITGTISTTRHAMVRYRIGSDCGDTFGADSDYDGLTLTIEVSGRDDALAMLEAIRKATGCEG